MSLACAGGIGAAGPANQTTRGLIFSPVHATQESSSPPPNAKGRFGARLLAPRGCHQAHPCHCRAHRAEKRRVSGVLAGPERGHSRGVRGAAEGGRLTCPKFFRVAAAPSDLGHNPAGRCGREGRQFSRMRDPMDLSPGCWPMPGQQELMEPPPPHRGILLGSRGSQITRCGVTIGI